MTERQGSAPPTGHEARIRPHARMLINMTAIRWLLGTVGVLLGVVLLILGVVLSPVLLLLAPIPIVIYLAGKFWWLRRKAGRGVERQKKRVRKGARKVKKDVKKSL